MKPTLIHKIAHPILTLFANRFWELCPEPDPAIPGDILLVIQVERDELRGSRFLYSKEDPEYRDCKGVSLMEAYFRVRAWALWKSAAVERSGGDPNIRWEVHVRIGNSVEYELKLRGVQV